jgi:hypothetical protein
MRDKEKITLLPTFHGLGLLNKSNFLAPRQMAKLANSPTSSTFPWTMRKFAFEPKT